MLTGVRQELTDLALPPSVFLTVTIQAPQPPSPHDTFVPVSSATSLMYWARLSWLDSGQTEEGYTQYRAGRQESYQWCGRSHLL